jgi:NAD(P)-dependent dehydrogenase (short-subunit alcohol dehydrogenase family)
MSGCFEGRAAIVTGSSSGIGKATALLMARRGAAVCVVANRNVEGGRATVQEIEAGGGRAVFVEADVSVGADCERVAGAALEAFGRVDVLVNNAGITRTRPLVEMDEAFWDMVLDTNLKSAYMMSRFVAADMLRRGSGSIVNVSSVHAEQTAPGHAAYAASKAGMCGMTRALALELGPKGLRVNCILPGTIDIRLYPRDDRPVDRASWQPRANPLQVPGRLGSPDETASAICFLASDEAAFINGATLVADGGLLCKLGDRPQ